MLMADPRAWLSSNETAADLLDRLERERPSLILPPLHRVPICAGNVVEITGPSPSAKSEILLQAAIHCILPKQWRGMHFGGLERNVAYVDLDCRFDVLRLAQVLKLRIFSSFGSVDSSCWDLNKLYTESSIMLSQDDHLYNELFLSCMKRFFYIRCYNSYEFLAALQASNPF
ncbi:hypothetical protein HPP92_017635 [Vanilla planifolia]|uniref:RecA family profile 1 domain-containing protein n=1 Tax=Vanilla planifolia TaxID=51239 RepID=A0A835UNL9_VANPL|nr:hypothetical protein HPP92_017635 [Vanilla planifolia]